MTILYAFLLYPERVYLNRGNHEDLRINLSQNFTPNFKKDTDLKFKKYGGYIFNKFQHLFQKLPLATILENNSGFRCFITHGGISSKTCDLDFISSLNRFTFPSLSVPIKSHNDPVKQLAAEIFTDLVWSDPITSSDSILLPKTGSHLNTIRNIGKLFGADVTADFCKRNRFDLIIRSHECRPLGNY